MEKLPLKIERVRHDLFEAEAPRRPTSSSPSPSSSTSSRDSFAELARHAEGLAKTDPGRLLSLFGLTDFNSRRYSSKLKAISNFILSAFNSRLSGEHLFKYLFESPREVGNKITIEVIKYDCAEGEEIPATSQYNCRRFINSLLLAGARLNKIQWDDTRDTCVAILDSGASRVEIKIN